MADRGKVIKNIDEDPGKTRTKPCQPCCRKNANNVAKVFCKDCDEFQCKECSKVHQHFPVMATHKLMNLSEAEFVSRIYDMKGLDLCKQHGKSLKFLCKDDNKLLCSTCAIVNHKSCISVIEVEKKTKVGGPALFILKRVLLDIDSKTKTCKQRTLKTKELLGKGETENVGKIQDMHDNVQKMFKELKQKVSHDISTFKEQAMNDLDTKVASWNTYAADIEQYLSYIENVTDLGTPSQQMIMFHYLKDQVRQLQQNTTKDIEEFKDVSMTFEFDTLLKLPPSMSVMPGRLTMEYLTASDVQRDSNGKKHKVQKVILKLLASIDLKQDKSDVMEPLYTGLDFLPDRRLITVDNKNKKCLVYNERLQLASSFVFSERPQDVVAVSEDRVAVTTDANLINFLEILDNHEILQKEKTHLTSTYQSISVIDSEHFVVGTIDDPQPVRIVSVSGEEKEVGINFPTKAYPIDHSHCTYIQNCNKVVLSDRYAHTLYIYDIASNTKVEVKKKKIIKEPRNVAVGPDDSIFFCNKLTNTLVQISHTGQILSSQVLDMLYPRSVSVSKDNTKLAVSNSCWRKKKLQLYSIEIL